ncbi:MAG: phage tail protein, partial [Actinomycetia bacterium]|nr:phage tail protein [Actinomycetes bacterium]
ALFAWMQQSAGDGFAANGNQVTRSTGAIVAMNQLGVRLRSWDIIDAFPVRWKGPDFVVDSTDPLSEELEIAHHGFTASTLGPS